jgi:hypothetical protein
MSTGQLGHKGSITSVWARARVMATCRTFLLFGYGAAFPRQMNDDSPRRSIEEATLMGTTVTKVDISSRVLHVAVPAGTTTAQWDQIAMAIQYGQTECVAVKITVIRP